MPDRSAVRTRRIVTVLVTILVLNLIVAIAKLLYGRATGILAIQADGFHSLLDASSNVIGLVGVLVARRPADDNHPYGHRKYETFAALGVAVMMFLGCWEIAVLAVERSHHLVQVSVAPASFVLMLTTLVVNVGVTLYERRVGRELQSEMLIADSAHTSSDVFASLLVMASLVFMRFGAVWADVAASGAVIVLILRAGFEILGGTVSTLSDERRVEPALIEHEALEEPGVLEVHNVRTRGPLDDIHADLHILVDPHMPIADAHAIGHRVEDRLRARWPSFTDVVVHVEPGLDHERATRREGGGLRAEG